MNKIDSFHGEYRFLSNFFVDAILYLGVLWKTLEHAFQAAKTDVLAERGAIRDAFSPGTAKALGKVVTLRAGWDSLRVGIMKDLLRIKFSKDPLKRRLLATKDAELIEGNFWHDNFWGNCVCGRAGCSKEGENMLGKLLMEVRSEIQKNVK